MFHVIYRLVKLTFILVFLTLFTSFRIESEWIVIMKPRHTVANICNETGHFQRQQTLNGGRNNSILFQNNSANTSYNFQNDTRVLNVSANEDNQNKSKFRTFKFPKPHAQRLQGRAHGASRALLLRERYRTPRPPNSRSR